MDITGSDCLKGVLVKVIVDEKLMKNSWKAYMEKLMNGISAGVKEGWADCMRISEVTAALPQWARETNAAPGKSVQVCPIERDGWTWDWCVTTFC